MNKVWSVDRTLVRTEESAGAFIRRCSVNKVFKKIAQDSQELLESLFNEVSGLKTCNIVEK